MQISEYRQPGVFILGLSQRLDATTAEAVEGRILEVVDAGDHRLVLDLSQLEHVTSAGLRVFVLTANRLRTVDGKLALCGLSDHLRHVFDIAGISSILSICRSRDEAITHVETA